MTEERKIVIKEPTLAQETEARKRYIHKYNELRMDKNSGFVPRAKLYEALKELGLWTEDNQKQIEKFQAELRDLLKPLKDGGISLQEMKERAIKAQGIRLMLANLNAIISEYDSDFTYESWAEDAKFQYLLFECAYYEDGEKVFETQEDYDNCTDKSLLKKATMALNNTLYGDIRDVYKRMPENQFLIEYGFMTESMESTEKPVEENEFKPFLDEDGNPITKKTAKPKRAKK